MSHDVPAVVSLAKGEPVRRRRSGSPIPGRVRRWLPCGFGATHTVSSRAADAVAAIQELTDGFGADVVIGAVGRPETYQQAFAARDLAGTVVLVGVPTPDMQLTVPLIDFFSRGGALKSSWYGDCVTSRC
jgi:S-(hydroxymethyl)mycothiol dehydrogenase